MLNNKNNTQINITISKEWKLKLEKLAREISFKENKNINSIDLIRTAINEKYFLDE